jgi:hypothetical protein
MGEVMAVDDVAAIDAARLIIGGQLIDGVPKPQWEPEYHISVELI